MNKKKILLVTYGGGHVHMIRPLAKMLHEIDRLEIVVLALPSAIPYLTNETYKVITFRDLIVDGDLDALRWGEEIAKKHHKKNSGINLEESIAYLGLSFKDLVNKNGFNKAIEIFKKRKRHAFHQTTIIRRALSLLKPNYVVTTNSPRAESAAIEEALLHEIPSLSMSDLFLGMKDYILKANRLTYLNHYAYSVNLKAGLVDPKRSNIHFVGNPAFDELLIRDQKRDNYTISKLIKNLTHKKSILHIHSHSWVDPIKGSINQTPQSLINELQILHKASQNSKVNFLIRPHPSEDERIFLEFAEKNDDVFIVNEFPLKELLKMANIITVRSSTVAMQALYLRKKVIQIDPHIHTDLPISNLKLAIGVPLCPKISTTISEVLCDEENKFSDNIDKFLPQKPSAPQISNIILQDLKI